MSRLFCAFFAALSLIVLPEIVPADDSVVRIPLFHEDFQGINAGGLPQGWALKSVRPSLAPKFSVETKNGSPRLVARGNGNPDCVGWISTRVSIERGKTYWFRARFTISDALNPLQNLRFLVLADGGSQGIGEFHRLDGGRVEGECRVRFAGSGATNAEVRILYRLCANGAAWIESVSLEETDPLPPRWVRVGCTQGPDTLEEYGLKAFSQALDAAGAAKVDLMLLPEYFNGEGTTETLTGPSARLMSEKAAKYHMYVAGTIGRYDPATDRLYNSALLFDRDGKMIGCYDKIHLYAPEMHDLGVTPGDQVPVFQADFGAVGFITCYDSWFPDVAELAALRGADILLFPNLGYDRGLMHARALDNRVHLVTSTRSGGYGVWDDLGRDIATIASETGGGDSFEDVVKTRVANMGLLMVTLDLNARSIQELNGGSRRPVLRSKRDQHNARRWLEDEIREEKDRWWVD